jgi:hypothetical protein
MTTMIAANQKAFERLISIASRSDRPIVGEPRARWIQTNEIEKTWLQETKIGAIERISNRTSTAILQFQENRYFATIGSSSVNLLEIGLVEEEMNAGLFTAIIAGIEVPINNSKTPLHVYELVFAGARGDSGYLGHSFEPLSRLLEPIHIYKIAENCPFPAASIERFTYYWSITSKETIILPFSARTYGLLESIGLDIINSIPFSNLLSAVQSAHWRHAFLELYQCIEALFSLGKIQSLRTDLQLQISLLDFAEKVHAATGWRPKEEDALLKLFDSASSTVRTQFDVIKNFASAQQVQNIPSWFYSLRNSIVHCRPALDKIVLDAKEWDELLEATLALIKDLYTQYDPHLCLKA